MKEKILFICFLFFLPALSYFLDEQFCIIKLYLKADLRSFIILTILFTMIFILLLIYFIVALNFWIVSGYKTDKAIHCIFSFLGILVLGYSFYIFTKSKIEKIRSLFRYKSLSSIYIQTNQLIKNKLLE